MRHGPETDDYNRDFIERDEKRLAELGRKTVEMYVIAHIIADLEVRAISGQWLCGLLVLLPYPVADMCMPSTAQPSQKFLIWRALLLWSVAFNIWVTTITHLQFT